MRKVRKLRHWKQRFNANARFMWRRNTTFDSTVFDAGTEVPKGLLNRVKLRRFWESKRIELWEFEDPNVATGEIDGKGDQPVLPQGVSVEKGKGSWYLVKIVGDEKDYRVNGKKKLAKFIAKLIATRAKNEKLRLAALEAEQREIEDLITVADEYAGIDLTPEQIGEWTEDELAEVQLYFEALSDDAQDDPEELPTVLSPSTDDDKTTSDGGDVDSPIDRTASDDGDD